MFSCKTCVPNHDRETDTVKVKVADIEKSEETSDQVIERWDKGQGHFVELREGDRLVVGAPTQEIADKLVQEWRERRAGKNVKDVHKEEASSTVDEDQEELSKEKAKAEEEEEERQRKEREAQEEAAELERQKAEEERVRKEAKSQERKVRVEEFLQLHGFSDVKTPKKVQEKVLGLPVKSKSIYAIHLAAELGDAPLVDMLIKEGADPQQKTSAGKTPFEVAKKKAKGGSHDAVLMALRPAKIGGA